MRPVLAIALLTACGFPRPPDIGSGDAPSNVDADPYTEVAAVPAVPQRALDLLFIVDDSPGMADKQATVAASMASLVNRLDTFQGGRPDLHIGFVSTDLGSQAGNGTGPSIGTGAGMCSGSGKSGNLQANNPAVQGSFVADIKQPDETRATNYTGSLVDVLSQMVRLGAAGCGFEQPLAAMKRALAMNPANAGFLRPEAALGIVFVGDEDDCSLRSTQMLAPADSQLGPLGGFRCVKFGVTCTTNGATPDDMAMAGPKDGCTASPDSSLVEPIEPYVSYLRGLKPEHKLFVAMIGAPSTPVAVELTGTQPRVLPSCMYVSDTTGAQEVGEPSVRLSQLLAQFPAQVRGDVCVGASVTTTLDTVGELAVRAIGTSCLSAAPLDTDTGTPGLQFDCTAYDETRGATTDLPACAGVAGETNCFTIEPDPTCTTAPNLALSVMRADPPSGDTVTHLRCRI